MEKYKLDLLGESKYNPNANPSVLNEFATAAFRFGHSMINSLFKVIFTNQEIFWRLSDLFNGKKFNGKHLIDIEPMILGLLNQNAQKVDGSFANEISDHLFQEHSPKRQTQFGGDLVARNIQRGRDHGIPSYNKYRQMCGLLRAADFTHLTEIPPAWVDRLKRVYKNPNDIDLFTGLLLEKKLPGAMVGPTLGCLLAMQFDQLRKCDR